MEIQLTQGKFAIIDDEDYQKINHRKWQYSHGYAVSGSFSPKNHLRMHRVILGLSYNDGVFVDHINGNRLDNRKENLRIASASGNQANKGMARKNTSGYKGVTYHKYKKKWMASAHYDGKTYFCGYYSDPRCAAMAYDKKARELWGEFARVNFNE